MKLHLPALVLVSVFPIIEARADSWLEEPLYWRNTSPFTGTHGLPRAKPAKILGRGGQRFSVSAEAANSFTRKATSRLDLRTDGETSLITVDFRRGLGAGYEVGLEIPWLRHHTGYLDGLINTYHDISGLPEKDRRAVPEGQLDFTWRYDGNTLASVQDEVSGIGDIRIYAGRLLTATEAKSVALRAELKLPTGDSNDLAGSGAADFSLSIIRVTASRALGVPLTVHLGGGVLYMGTGEVAPGRQKRLAVTGLCAIATKLGERWSVVAQADAHTALYDTDHSVPGSWSVQGGISLRRAFGDRWSTEIVIYEDLRPGSATDFTLALRTRFRTR